MNISSYRSGDEQEILNLFELSFAKRLPDPVWEWRYLKNPSSMQMIYLMRDSGLLVGHYAVSPVYFVINNEKVLSGLSMTTMTHPQYGGRGIFSTLANNLYQTEKEKSGLNMVWGFPNTNSHYGFIKNLEWKDVCQIPTFSIRPALLNEVKDLKIDRCVQFTRAHEATYFALTKDFSTKVHKDVSYLNWRYFQHPERPYNVFELESSHHTFFMVTKLYYSANGFEIDILEMVVPDDLNIISNFLSCVLRNYSEHTIERINMWLPFTDKKHILLEKIGFRDSTPITYLGYRNLALKDSNVHYDRWHFSMGDSDVF